MQARDPDGTPAGSIRFTVLDVVETGDRSVYTVKRELSDDESGMEMSTEYTMECDDEKMYIDTRAFYNPVNAEMMEGMDVEIESKNLVMPAGLDVGDHLPEANMTITIRQGSVAFSTMTFKLSGKEVTGRETLTVPAGRFDCLKIEGKLDVETKVMDRLIATHTRTVEWYSPGMGKVKSESYNESGDLTAIVVLAERF